MILRLKLALGLLSVLALVHVHSKQHTFKTVNILYRHGERTPTHIFPTDIWKDSWKEGLGQLTNVGKMQHFELGQFLRKRYTGFLNDKYNATDIVITSTDVDRTLMSAYCNLAGWYPPAKDQRWNANLAWQPIPVHTIPVIEDYLLSFVICPKYDKLMDEVKVSPDVVAFNDAHRELYDQLSNYSGEKVESVFDVSGIYNTLMIEKLSNLTLPKWADDAFLEKLHECEKKDFLWSVKTDELSKLHGGLLVGEMIQNMENAGKKRSRKAYVYSAHDVTLVGLLSALHLYDGTPPPYASAVIVELHNHNDSVRIFYRNTTESEPYELHMPNCSNPCSLKQFKQLTEKVVPKNIIEECQVSLWSSDYTLIDTSLLPHARQVSHARQMPYAH